MRSPRYVELEERVKSQFWVRPADDRELHWWNWIAPKWRNRVGLPRLVAEEAFFEALSTVRSVNRGVFRNDPEGRERFDAAVAALDELAGEFARENWRRFQGGERDAS